MRKTDRRSFLKLMGVPAAAAALPVSITRALAIDANNRTGSIADVEHVVFLMQENRSFDHYFGTMRGVRGFADPRAVKLPSGQPVWYQPDGSGGFLLPFRPNVPNLGGVFLEDLPHGWTDQHAAWNQGNYDQWVPVKSPATMAHLTRKDLPYHYALADAFTVCDAYHCSVLGPTDPNRYHMWTGWLGNDGSGGGPVVDNAEAGYGWSTYPERLQNAGISWKIYQDIGDGLNGANFWGWTPDPYIGNYGDNSLLYFFQYQNALPGNSLADFAKTGTNIAAQGDNPAGLLDIFRADVNSGNLPQVSWIVAPEAYTEHPNWVPNYAKGNPDLIEPNITPWRRTVAGDLTSAFNFAKPNNGPTVLPGTDADVPTSFVRYPDFVPVPPTNQLSPGQEQGVRPARPLPYDLNAQGTVLSNQTFLIDFENCGQAGAVFQVRSGNGAAVPRTYTVEPQKQLSDTWPAPAGGPSSYDLEVHGPNGFFRSFKGSFPQNGRSEVVNVRLFYDKDNNGVRLVLSNQGSQEVEVSIVNKYTGKTHTVELELGQSASKSWELSSSSGWYDFVITLNGDPVFEYEIAGHLENGKDSTSDPAMGGSH